MSTISVSMTPGTATHGQFTAPVSPPPDAGSETAVLRAMAEAERLIGEFTVKQNAQDMKESLLRREAALQKKQASVYDACEKEKSAASWRFATRLASGVLGMLAGGITIGGVVGSGRQMNKAAAEGSLANMTGFTPRGHKLDTWNRIGQSAQCVQQGASGVTTAIGEQQATDNDVQKKYQDVHGQMSDNDAQLAMDMQRRRSADLGDANKRVEKLNEMRLEFLRSAVRTLA